MREAFAGNPLAENHESLRGHRGHRGHPLYVLIMIIYISIA